MALHDPARTATEGSASAYLTRRRACIAASRKSPRDRSYHLPAATRTYPNHRRIQYVPPGNPRHMVGRWAARCRALGETKPLRSAGRGLASGSPKPTTTAAAATFRMPPRATATPSRTGTGTRLHPPPDRGDPDLRQSAPPRGGLRCRGGCGAGWHLATCTATSSIAAAGAARSPSLTAATTPWPPWGIDQGNGGGAASVSGGARLHRRGGGRVWPVREIWRVGVGGDGDGD